MHVFLSYSRRDADFVGRLADDLAARGIDPWLDTEDLAAEDDDRWRRAVVQGIRESVAIVLVLSPDSVQSGAVERELTIAAEMERRIIPILHRTCVLSDGLMFELAGLQRTDFVDRAYEDALAELVQRIGAGPATRAQGPPGTVGPDRDRGEADAAASGAATAVRATTIDDGARNDDRPRARRGTTRVLAAASFAAVVAALAAVEFFRDGDANDTADRLATPSVTERPAVADGSPETTVGGSRSEGSSAAGADQAALVPWEEATATFERTDGTTTIVRASTVALACATGNLELTNGQTVSLEKVRHIHFDTNHSDTGTIDAVVTLLDGRELQDPIRTRNCPIGGTTDLGPLAIPPDDIRRITFDR